MDTKKEYYKNYYILKSEDRKEYRKIYMKKYRLENKNKIVSQVKERYKNDILFKLKSLIRVSINKTFNKTKNHKNTSTIKILGCTIEEFKLHIESQFEPWMNWENQGSKIVTKPNQSWDIDHILPLSSAKTEEDIIRLNHYLNLKPICSYHNRYVKRNNIGMS